MCNINSGCIGMIKPQRTQRTQSQRTERWIIPMKGGFDRTDSIRVWPGFPQLQISPFTCIWCTLSANSWRLSLSSASIASIPKYTTSFWVSLVASACFWITSLIAELTAIAVLVLATKNNQLLITTFLDVTILSPIKYNNVWLSAVNHAIV